MELLCVTILTLGNIEIMHQEKNCLWYDIIIMQLLDVINGHHLMWYIECAFYAVFMEVKLTK